MRQHPLEGRMDFLQTTRHALVSIAAGLSNNRTDVSRYLGVERNDVATGDLNSL
jgi:hypothetical protein